MDFLLPCLGCLCDSHIPVFRSPIFLSFSSVLIMHEKVGCADAKQLLSIYLQEVSRS